MSRESKPCIQCLLRDMDAEDEYKKLKKYLESFDSDIRTTEAEYERRLALCRECTSLREGICGKCGCFVEARALRKQGICPHEIPRW